MAKTAYWNGRIRLNTGKLVTAHLMFSCASVGECVCGFRKGQGQCEFGDCRGETASPGSTLCDRCSASTWKVALAGHRGA